jgi:uncharacterized protein
MCIFVVTFRHLSQISMQNELVGRKPEIATLQKVLASKEAELIAIVGRRRIGKTFLVQSVFQDQMIFEVAGMQNSSTKKQLQNFHLLVQSSFGELANQVPKPTDWLTAFHQLSQILDRLPPTEQKRVLFFDELPWLDNRKSGFLEAFSNFWNIYASRKQLVVVICGSAASWMIQKVVYHKGGLHNRITQTIQLQPFTLAETEAYLLSRNIGLDRYQILQLYMATGGVPHYLKDVQGGQTAAQNIEHMFFSLGNTLRNEFLKLFPALFEQPEQHMSIVRILGQSRNGLDRKTILERAKISDGGAATRYLLELEQSGFITPFYPLYKKKKQVIYRLTDEYSLFYVHFIEQKRVQGNDTWQHFSQTQAYKTWCSYAFESICLKHIAQIKQALGISGIYSEASTFYAQSDSNETGVQVDLLIDRKDDAINVFELKFYAEAISLTSEDAAQLRERIRLFKYHSKTKKQVFLNFVAPFGMKNNQYSLGLVHSWFELDVLF